MRTPFEIWPAERTDLIVLVPEARSDNSPQRVVELLAAADGVSVQDYLRATTPDLVALRELARHSADAVLAAALVAPDLRPVSVLGVLSSGPALAAAC